MNACASVCRHAVLILASLAPVVAAQTGSTQAAKTQPSAQAPPASANAPRKPGASASTAGFDRLLAAATEARQAQRWEEAIELYGKVVKLKPAYVEGYWYQGTAYYSLDNFPQCREIFRKVVRLAPKNGAAYAFLGLCEFGVKDYDRSLQHLL